MPITTTAAEFHAFINDDAHWNASKWDHYDDTVFIVDEKEIYDVDTDALTPETKITLVSGDVCDTEGAHGELLTFFRKWRKQQETHVAVIKFPHGLSAKQISDHLAKLDKRIILEGGS